MQDEPVPPQNDRITPGGKPRLTPAHAERIGELSGIYLSPSAEAVELSEDDLLSNLSALWKMARQQGSGMKKAHAKAIEKMVLAADATIVPLPASRQLPSSRHLLRGGNANVISAVHAKLLSGEVTPAEKSALAREIFGPKRIESEAAISKLEREQVDALKAKYKEFVEAAVKLLKENDVRTPQTYQELVDMWRAVSSIIWSNFSQAEHFDNGQHLLATSLQRDILNCATSTFIASDIMRQFGVESTEIYVARAMPDSGHAILHCKVPGQDASAFVQTRAQYPDFYSMELSFGTYRTMEEVSKAYPLIFRESDFPALADYSSDIRMRANSVIALREGLKEKLDADPGSPELLFRAGQFARRHGDADAADFFKRAVEADPHFIEAWLALADACLNRGYYGDYKGKDEKQSRQDAVKALEKGIGQNPESAILLERLAGLCEDNERSIALRTKAIRIEPTARLYANRGYNYMRIYAENEGEDSEWKRDPKSDSNAMKAISDFEKAVEIDPSMLWVHEQLSTIHRAVLFSSSDLRWKTGHMVELEEKLAQIWDGAIGKNRNDPLFYEKYADVLVDFFQRNDWSCRKALALYTHAIILHPTHALLMKRADMHSHFEEYGRERDDLKKAIELYPRDPYAYYRLAYVYQRVMDYVISHARGSGPLPRGIKEVDDEGPLGTLMYDTLKDGIKTNPTSHILHFYLGERYERNLPAHTGSYSIEHYENALRLLKEQKPEKVTSDYLHELMKYEGAVASAALDKRDYDKATEHIDEMKKLDNLAKLTYKRKEQLSQLEKTALSSLEVGDFDKALELIEKAKQAAQG